MYLLSIKKELTGQFPEYSFSTVRRLQGICIVVTKSKYHGADIFIKKNKIIIEAGFPAFKTRLLWGAGVLWKKTFDKEFYTVAIRVKSFLGRKYNTELRDYPG